MDNYLETFVVFVVVNSFRPLIIPRLSQTQRDNLIEEWKELHKGPGFHIEVQK